MSNMDKQGGFTLVELITVIVILGLLAVFAIPRYFAMIGDANKGVILGVEGALQSAVALAKAKAKLDGLVVGTTGQSVTLENGLGGTTTVALTKQLVPKANVAGIGNGTGITGAIDLRDSQTRIIITPGVGPPLTMTYRAASAGGTCQVVYSEVAATDANVTISTNVSGCKP